MSRIGICTIIKNEHLYLKEWIDYHLKLGISHIWLFEDYGSLSHSDITSNYPDSVTLMSASITGAAEKNPLRQCAVFSWFSREMKNEIDWCAFIDIDEFIVLSDGTTLNDLCNRFSNSEYNGFVLYWKIYNASGHIQRPEGCVQDCYKVAVDVSFQRDLNIRWNYKSIVNIKKVSSWFICHTPGNVCDLSGSRVDIRILKNNPPIFTPAYIAHYFTKSWEDWMVRMKRGGIAAKNRDIDLFFALNPDLIKYKNKLVQ